MVDEQKCLFCGITNGSIPSLKVYEGKNVMAVLSIKPATKGHVLIIPKVHQAYLQTLNGETLNFFSVAISIGRPFRSRPSGNRTSSPFILRYLAIKSCWAYENAWPMCIFPETVGGGVSIE